MFAYLTVVVRNPHFTLAEKYHFVPLLLSLQLKRRFAYDPIPFVIGSEIFAKIPFCGNSFMISE